MTTPPSGLLLVVSSPSGAGKTTLCRRLLSEHPELQFSVSYTTRPPRSGERDGIDYHFVSDATFDEMVQQGAFAEWNWVHGRRYGTSLHAVQQALASGCKILLDIDYQGAARILEVFAASARLVFILPPSLAVLEAPLARPRHRQRRGHRHPPPQGPRRAGALPDVPLPRPQPRPLGRL
jgi:guanylate kinase